MLEEEATGYLGRIGFYQKVCPTYLTLKTLHSAHIQTVPFETFDILFKKPFSLNYDELYRKIVVSKRGGYCYELSGLFSFLLKSIGFKTSLHNAQLFDSSGKFLPSSQHLVLITYLDGRWLVDVGYGNGFLEPLSLDHSDPQIQGDRAFRCLIKEENFVVQEKKEDSWGSLYAFNLEPKQISDFETRNQFHQTSPDSVFFGKRICMLGSKAETFELLGNSFTRTIGGKTEIQFIPENDVPNLLKRYFGLTF